MLTLGQQLKELDDWVERGVCEQDGLAERSDRQWRMSRLKRGGSEVWTWECVLKRGGLIRIAQASSPELAREKAAQWAKADGDEQWNLWENS